MLKKILKVLAIIIGCLIVLILGSIVSILLTPTSKSTTTQPVDSVVVNTTESEETTVEETSSTIEEESSTIVEETTTVEEDDTTPESSTEFSYTDEYGTTFTKSELQEWLLMNDRSVSDFSDVLDLSDEELIAMYEERVVIERDRELNDYGDEGFWDDYEEDLSDSMCYINSVNDYKNWFRNAKEGDVICITSSAGAEVGKVFGNNDEVLISIFESLDSCSYLYIESINGSIPNVMADDAVDQLVATYTGERGSNNGYLIFNCDSITIK